MEIRATAQGQVSRAEVRAIKGKAFYSTNGGPAMPLKVGAILSSGATIQTGPDSTIDLFLGLSAGILRIAEKSTLSLDKLTLTDTGVDTAVEVQLNLPDGDMYFNVNKLSKASRYEIKMPNGVAGIRGTRGSFSSRPAGSPKPPVVLLEGKVVFVHAAADGQLSSYVMSAPPAVYFSTTDGVNQAPPGLVREVEKQLEESGKQGRNNAPPPQPSRDRTTEASLSPGAGARARQRAAARPRE